MAIVGPLMSFAIGIGGLVLAGLLSQAKTTPDDPMEAARAFGPVATCLAWLGPVNITLGLFNMIPGFPLDGGRVLRAALWAATGSLHKATSWASATGRAVGWLFIAIGIMMAFGTRVPFFGQGAGSGLWLVFIGWFLSSAASRSYEGMLVDQALGDVRVEQLMRRSARALDPRVTIDEAVHGWFVRADARAFPVVDDDRLVGLMRAEDAVAVPREAWKTEVVGAVMSPLSDAVTTTPQEDVATALRKLGHAELEQLPVVEDGALVGVIERSAIARWLEVHPGSGGGHPTPRAT
jgi:CBS domain-containing protein